MLNDSRLTTLVDYSDSRDCFPGVDIAGGVCYFLWERDRNGLCDITNIYKGKTTHSIRALNEFPVFIRHSVAVDIIKKVQSFKEPTLNDVVFSSKPFGFRSFEEGRKTKKTGDVEMLGSKSITYVALSEVTVNQNEISRWKVVMSKASAEHAGQTDNEGRKKIVSRVELLAPGVICTETYLLLQTFSNQNEAENFVHYVKTRFFRFLLSTILLTQNIAKDKFMFIPNFDFSNKWTDDILYSRYKLSKSEIEFIKSQIKEME